MAEPSLVADCVVAIKANVGIPVTVKCRIGIDDQNPLFAFTRIVKMAGVDALIVHARKALAEGIITTRESRSATA
jgi:tRNA-dihydrouridine synthase A